MKKYQYICKAKGKVNKKCKKKMGITSIQLTQPQMRKIFFANRILISEQAEKLVLQIHLALGGELLENEESRGILPVSRGEIRDWRSFDDAVTYNGVTSRDQYQDLWNVSFPHESEDFYFSTIYTKEGVQLIISDGKSSVLLSRNAKGGEYMIPQVGEILKAALSRFVEQ